MRYTHRQQVKVASKALSLAESKNKEKDHVGLRLRRMIFLGPDGERYELNDNSSKIVLPSRKEIERFRQLNVAKDAIEELSEQHYQKYLQQYGSNSEVKTHVEKLGHRLKRAYFNRADLKCEVYNGFIDLTSEESAHVLVLQKIIKKCDENMSKASKFNSHLVSVLSKTPKTIFFAVGDTFFAGMAMVLNPIAGVALTLTSGLANSLATIQNNRKENLKALNIFMTVSQTAAVAAYWWAGFQFASALAEGRVWPGVIAGLLTISKATKVIPMVFFSALKNTTVILSKILPAKPEISEN